MRRLCTRSAPQPDASRALPFAAFTRPRVGPRLQASRTTRRRSRAWALAAPPPCWSPRRPTASSSISGLPLEAAPQVKPVLSGALGGPARRFHFEGVEGSTCPETEPPVYNVFRPCWRPAMGTVSLAVTVSAKSRDGHAQVFQRGWLRSGRALEAVCHAEPLHSRAAPRGSETASPQSIDARRLFRVGAGAVRPCQSDSRAPSPAQDGAGVHQE